MKLFKQAPKCKTFKEMKEIVLKANDEDSHDSQIEIDGFHQDENDQEKNDEEPEEDINEQEEYEEETENKEIRKKYAFLILFGPGLSSIRIFVKKNMDQFMYHYIDCKINIALKSIDVDFSKIKKNSLLFNVLRYYSSLRHEYHHLVRKYIQGLGTFSKKKEVRSTKEENDVQGILNFCSGFIKVLYQEKPSYDLHYHNIQIIIIIFPWSLDALNKCDYLQLDSSFKGMRPYAYCVSHCIIQNESMPLSITIAPRECSR